METQAEYETRSRREAWDHILEIERSPLSERKEARADYAAAMRDPALIAERISWLLDGNYGFGEMLLARAALKGRGNVEANVAQLAAVFEWRCPSAMSRAAWRGLTKRQQEALSRAIRKVLKAHESDAE